MTKIPNTVREAINAIVEYLAHDEIAHLADCGPADHISQSVIALAKWAGGDAWAAVEHELERHEIVLLPSGHWGSAPDSVEDGAIHSA